MAIARVTERRRLVGVGVGSLVSLLGAIFAVACSSSTSPAPIMIDAGDAASTTIDAPVEAAPSCVLPARFGSAKCGTCVTEQCCAPLDACAADPDCVTLSSCTLACIEQPDAGACAADCRAKTSDPKGLWAALEKCAYFSKPCTFECSVASR